MIQPIQDVPGQTLKVVVTGILRQAQERQQEAPGSTYVGAVLQYLVGAKLKCILGDHVGPFHSFSTSDEQSGRSGDFVVEDVAIHVTTAPGEALIERCRSNLENSLWPLIITVGKGVKVAEGLAENSGLSDRLEVFDAEQFLASNFYEIGRFRLQRSRGAIADLIREYNLIIETYETDPSLRIEFAS
jgi:Domain of unknown function (DUF4928)